MTALALLALFVVAQAPSGASGVVSSDSAERVRVSVLSGQVVIGAVDQGETDLALTVIAPDGRRVGRFDARERSGDVFAFVSGQSGPYTLEVRTVGAGVRQAPFRLQWTIQPRSPGTEQFVVASGLHSEAKRLFSEGNRAALEQAIARLRQVGPMWRALGEPGWELAALTGTADARYMMSDYEGALATYRTALSASRRLQDVRTEAEILNNMAMVSWPLGDVEHALEWLGEARDRWRTLTFTYGEAIAVSNRGILLWEAGEYDDARQQYLRALDLFERAGDRRGQAYVLNNLGVLLEALGEDAQALGYLARAIPLFREAGDWLAEGRAEVRRTRILVTRGELPPAERAIERALGLIRRSADRLAEADALVQRARLLDRQGKPEPAGVDYERALTLYRDVGSRRGAADVLHDLGVSRLARGQPAAAVPILEQALGLRRALGLKALEADTLFQLADAARRLGRLDAARQRIEEALPIIEALRVGVLEKQSRASYAESKRQYYASYVDLLVDSHEASPDAGYERNAFEASERARARGLSELLHESWSAVVAAVPRALSQREQTLRKQINYWSWQLWQRAAEPERTARQTSASAALERVIAEHDQAIADIRRSDPRYSSILLPDSIPLDAIQRELLDAESALVAFHLGTRHSLAWVVTRDTVHMVELPPRAEIEQLSAGLLALMAAPTTSAADVASAASALSRAVLLPVARALRYRRLVIVGDGRLHAVPFAALPTPDGTPLMAAHELVMMPSATAMVLIRRQFAHRTPAIRSVAVLADPVFDSSDPRVHRRPGQPRPALPSARLTRLPFSRAEAERILSFAAGRAPLRALDFDASRTTATSPALGEYRYIHLATHAIQDPERPSLSGIALSMVDESGTAQDGFLRLHDVYNLRLTADLVTLSACETGTGPVSLGEGVASLARGLFHAGAARVVSTLWRVDDEATAYMMQLFYERLLSSDAPEPAEALRQAQAEMRAHPRWGHPYYWASFILQGQW